MKGIKKQNKKSLKFILFKAFILCVMTAAYYSLLHAKLHKKKNWKNLTTLLVTLSWVKFLQELG